MRQAMRTALRASAVTAGAGAFGVAAGIAASAVHFARRVLTPAVRPESAVTVWAVESVDDDSRTPSRVWLQGADADLPGRYSFIFDDGAGHARLGPVDDKIWDHGVERVAREVVAIDSGKLAPGVRGRVTGWWFTRPDELGFAVREVVIPLEDGDGWGWVIEPEQPVPGRWAIHVHGRGALPQETLRGVAPFARAGVTSLVITYRNDPGAPRGLRGRYGLGLAERYDVDAAIAWALRQGATRVTLAGWSMGGTASIVSATRGPFRARVDGLMLDSPGLDWPAILRRQARLARAPQIIAEAGMWLMRRGIVRGAIPFERATDLESLTPEALAPRLSVPVLIHASPGDSFVPWGGSVRLAHLRPDLVHLREAAGEHVKLWNVDQEGWEVATEEFVAGLADPPAHRP